ncbi:MAG: Rne/Rng family ribonuclease [Bacteroidetes bacterium]|nr:MAG: Rne/Rng family ribonuclease [Bacteroidota bacterium]
MEEISSDYTVGDIYLGVVRKIAPGLNSAFVDVGHEKDAFLPYSDLGASFPSMNKFVRAVMTQKNPSLRLAGVKMENELDKFGKITQVLQKNHQILVQIIKEPIGTKGYKLSCDISLAGRYIVLVPFSNSVNISKKIVSKEERQRLLKLLSSIKPPNFGVIVRTVAEGRDVDELSRDMLLLVEKWEAGMQKLATAKPHDQVIGEMNRASSILRDMLNDNFDTIWTDDRATYEDVRQFVKSISPTQEKIVKLYTAKTKIFEQFGLEKQLKMLFGKVVSMPNGGYLVIEHTEALHVIDVNSGTLAGQEQDLESTALRVNLEAATEIARQLRIRDMGGIIVIDFIDMRSPDHKRQVYQKMRDEMRTERAKYTVLPLSKFGLMQITRQRVRPQMDIITQENCPTCGGTGTIGASILIEDTIEQLVEYLITKQNEKGFTITLHPYLYAYFTKGGWFSKQSKWFFRYRRRVKLLPDASFGLTQYVVTNRLGEEIEIESKNPKPEVVKVSE